MMNRTLRFGALGALLAVLGCSSSNDTAKSAEKTTPAVKPTLSPIAAAVAHRDARIDTPSFVWLNRSDAPKFDSAVQAAAWSIKAAAPAYKLSEAAIASLSAPEIHDNGGPIVARFTQRVAGHEVFRGTMSIIMSRSFEPVAASGIVARDVEAKAEFTLAGDHALAIAHQRLTKTAPAHVALLGVDGDTDTFTAAGLSQPARVKKVMFPTRRGLVPGYRVEVITEDKARSYVVDARTGAVLFDNDLVRYDAFTYRVYADPTSKLPWDGPQGNAATPHPTGKQDNFKPAWQPQQLVTLANFPFSKNDPWLPTGATTTDGNNVTSCADLIKPNGFSPSTTDVMGTTTSTNTFDYLYDTTKSPATLVTSQKASATNMFYLINFLHDWYYDAGFDERSGNHQKDNFGRGGKGNDALKADTQDYSGRNNANAMTPSDGASPRIQMYVFSGPSNAHLNITAPASIAGQKTVGIAGQFGQDAFNVSGPVALVNDGAGADVNDACEALTAGSLTGKIALIHRGQCAFVDKAKNAKAAGATGVIIANVASSSSPNSAPFMGGTDATLGTLPILSLSMQDGQALENALASGATVTLFRDPQVDLDGALDTTIVAHEWGHVLSNRLVADGDGLNSLQGGGMGEGWGDFSALMVAVRPDDPFDFTGIYPMSTYAMSGGDDFYFGMRRVPYSTDMTKDPLTFKHIADGNALPTTAPISFGEDGSFNSEVHNTGEVWATMLWECYAALLKDKTRFTFAQAQDRMKKYLVASLKLTPPDPTVLEARDAVLAAAYATDPKDFELFWQAFAKRGAGVGATGPEKDSPDNNPVSESFKVGNDVQIVKATLADDVISCDHDGYLDEGEVGTIEITIRNAGVGSLTATTAKATSKIQGVSFSDDGKVTFNPLKPFEAGSIKIKTFIKGAKPIEPIDVEIAVDDPSLAQPRTLKIVVPTRHMVDEAPETSKIDNVDTINTAWKAEGTDQFGTTKPFHRIGEGANKWWHIANGGEPSDHTLTSPKITVKNTTFGLAYKHRWAFESSDRQKKDFDGGVVEISLDDGKTWRDIGELGQIDYNVTLDNDAQGTNPLKGRKAYGKTSPDYPKTWVNTLVKVTLPAPGDVRVRFRQGSDDNTAEFGWEIDDITLTDVENNPFWSFVPHRDECDPKGPRTNAGAGKTVPPNAEVTQEGSGTHPENKPLTFMWTQVGGPPVQMNGDNTTKISFKAPDAKDPITLSFALRAHDGSLLSPASKVDIVVKNPDAAGGGGGSDSGGCGCRTAPTSGDASTLLLTGLVLGLVRRRRNQKKPS